MEESLELINPIADSLPRVVRTAARILAFEEY